MTRSTQNLVAVAVALVGGLLVNGATAAGAGIDVFNIAQPTHAVVDMKTDVYPGGGADNSNTYDSGYIYNIFGAMNPGVNGTGNMLFSDGHATDFVDFHTALPVNLTDVKVSDGGEDADSGGLGGNRGYTSFTFQQYTDSSYTTAIGPAYTYNNSGSNLVPTGSFADLPVSITDGDYFRLSFAVSGDANLEGVRVNSVEGIGSIVPEPSSVVAFCGLGAVGLFAAVRRYRKAQSAKA